VKVELREIMYMSGGAQLHHLIGKRKERRDERSGLVSITYVFIFKNSGTLSPSFYFVFILPEKNVQCATYNSRCSPA
jgi:hypothetical protein